MKLIDLHIHTGLSPDGSGELQTHYDKAVELGFQIVGFSDHIDYEIRGRHEQNQIILEQIREKFFPLKKSEKCKPLLGIELAYQKDFEQTVREDLEIIPELDFIIGSIHEIDGLGFSGGRTVKEFFDTHRKHAFTKYFDSLAEFVENGIYDVIGHFDIVKRFSAVHGYIFKPVEYRTVIGEILKIITSKNKGIEINTSGYFQLPEEPFPNMKIVEWFFEAGGKWLTVGSDSHTPETVGRGCKQVSELLLDMGIKDFTYFEKRTPKLVKLI